MEVSSLLSLFLQYALLPLLTTVCTMGWAMIKKQDARIDDLERRACKMDSDMAEVRIKFFYISQHIDEIKEMLVKLSDK